MGAVENLAVVQLPLHVAHDALPKRSHPGQVVLVRFVMMRRICRPDRSTARFLGGLTRSDKGDSVNLGLYGVYPYVGGALRADLLARDDAALVDVLCAELRNLLGITAVPELTRVHPPPAMPQYAVGHLDRGAAIEARMAALPALALAGAAYRGVGVPDCVRSGEADADGVLAATSTATG